MVFLGKSQTLILPYCSCHHPVRMIRSWFEIKTSWQSLYISSCHKAHKALTFSFHPLRFAAKALTVIHDCHPATRLSSSTILLHVVFGRPGLLLPSGHHSNAVTQCSSLFFLIICPIQFHLRRLISSLVLFTPVVSPPLLWPPLQCCNTVLLSVLPHYMSDPIPSSASDLIACSVHSCGLSSSPLATTPML